MMRPVAQPAAAAPEVLPGKDYKLPSFPVKPPPPLPPQAKEEVWEVRPGGMLVQKRVAEDQADAKAAVPTIRVKVKYAGQSYDVYVSSQASFGELKKLLAPRTGLHPEDQKLLFKDRERDSKAFLDNAGVKDKSRMVLLEDPTAQAKRLLELRRAGKMERAAKVLARVTHDVDKLASKVSVFEAIVNKGGRVVEADVAALTESLMNELVKLDAVAGDGDLQAQRQTQEKRVQKYVETLDVIKMKNAAAARADAKPPPARPHQLPPRPPAQSQRRHFPQHTAAAPTAAATEKWESFDLLSSMPSTSSKANAAAAAPRLEWELF